MSKINLNQKLKFIGMRLSVNDSLEIKGPTILRECDLERVLIDAAYAAKEEEDYRLLSILLRWIKVFGEYVIVEKFEKLAKLAVTERGENSILNAIAVWGTIHKQTKWTRLIQKTVNNSYIVDPTLTESSAKYPGFQPEWRKYGIKLPLKMLRDRESDVFTMEELAKKNHQFRNRLLYGSSWRSDIITANELGFETIREIEITLGCSHEPAYRISKEFKIVEQSRG